MEKKDGARQFAWDNFSRTGQIGYYLFYRALTFGEADVQENKGDSIKEK